MLNGEKLSDLLAEKAPTAYYVGGCLLDSILGSYSADIDLALPRKDVKTVAKELGLALKAAVLKWTRNFAYGV